MTRTRQVEITLICKDRFGATMPQTVLVPGETPVHQLIEAVKIATEQQTVLKNVTIVKISLGRNET